MRKYLLYFVKWTILTTILFLGSAIIFHNYSMAHCIIKGLIFAALFTAIRVAEEKKVFQKLWNKFKKK